MTTARIREIIRILAEERPDPESELHFSTPFELLVAVMLSAQATDKSVNLATDRLFPVANTPEAIVALGIEGLEPYIRTIGLFHSKAKHVVAMSEILIARHNSQVPENFESLTALPGVGAKTANVILNVAFGHPTIAVDTHIFRVAHRTRLSDANTPEGVSKELTKAIPAEYLKNAHHWLLLHGRYCCKARKPLCAQCPIEHLCHSSDKVL